MKSKPIEINPIFPSILSTNFFNLEPKLQLMQTGGITCLHLDIMDGHFVDTITFGPSMCRSIHDRFPFRLDAHLMVSNPGHMIPQFIKAGAEWISIHIETEHVMESLAAIRNLGGKPGLAINPDCPIEKVFPMLPEIDFLLIMSVVPGQGGQKFIPQTLERVRVAAAEIERLELPCKIQVDGGIRSDNVDLVQEAGAHWFVVGTNLYNSDQVDTTINEIFSRLR